MKKINLYLLILIILLTQVVICDNLIYFFKANYIIGNIIALIINATIVTLLIKKKKIKVETNFHKFDLVFLAIILVITGLTIIYPDTFWDTYSYHLYLQENPFADKINENFFPGRTLTSFVYPIADRVFYMFRALLGFRLGTLPGYFLIVIIYYQIKKYLMKILENKIDEKYISLLSILPLGVFIILEQLGTYYIDNFSVALLLEIMYVIFFEGKDIFKEKTRLYILAYVVGLAVCTKLTNAIYILGPLVYLLIINIKDIKNIKIYDYLLLVITFVIPLLPYVVDAIVQTGSPVFPYYNTIFKSEYFMQENWVDDRYGPKNILEFLLWPFYIIKRPRNAYETANTDLMFAIGYAIIIIGIIYEVVYKKLIKKQQINKKYLTFYILLMYLYLVWAQFIIGYTRYAGIIPIFASIACIYILINAFKNSKLVITVLMSAIICGSSFAGLYKYVVYSRSGGNYIQIFFNNSESAIANWKQNVKKTILLKDRTNEKYDIDGVWGVLADDSGVTSLLNVDDRLVELQIGTKMGKTEKTYQMYWDLVLNNDIYMPIYEFKLKDTLDYLNRYHFQITEVVDTLTNVSFLDNVDYIYIVKVKYDENAHNTLEMLTYDENELTLTPQEGKINFNVTINGRYLNKDLQDTVTVNVVASKNGQEQIIDTLHLKSDGKAINYEKKLDGIDYDTIKVKLVSEELKLRTQNHSITIFR